MRNVKRVLYGLLLIAGAMTILLESLGTISIGLTITNGIFAILLSIIFIDSVLSLHFFGIFVAPAIIASIFASQLGIESITPWPLISAAALVGIGFSIIFGHRHKSISSRKYNREFEEEVLDGKENAIDIGVKFGATAKYIQNDNLEYVNCDVSFGAAKIYFDKAKLKDNKVTLDLNVHFGGVELYIPREWNVDNKASASLGGIDEKNEPSNKKGENTIIIKGNVCFSGVEIIYI